MKPAEAWDVLERFYAATQLETDVTVYMHVGDRAIVMDLRAYDRTNGRRACFAVVFTHLYIECHNSPGVWFRDLLRALGRVLQAREDERARYVPRSTS